jgi:hypothetical protein
MTMTDTTPAPSESTTHHEREPEGPASASASAGHGTARDHGNWADPVARLSTTATGVTVDTVTGRRAAGPVQGFGQLWQKTFRVRLDGTSHTPADVVAHWKAAFPSFWPPGSTFYAPLAGIAPGEVALFEVQAVPGAPLRMSTGILVIYADDESFAFMTSEGHALAAWITFSAYRDGDVTIAQAQALERTSDPFIELTYLLGANRQNDRFWERTMANLATSLGVIEPVITTERLCVDSRRQWRHARNIRHTAAVGMTVGMLRAPGRWLRRRGGRPG